MMVSTVRGTVAVFLLVGFFGFQTVCNSEDMATAEAPVVATDRQLERFDYDSVVQVEQLIKDLNYTPEAWQAGIREVPRLYITNVPLHWREKTSKELDVQTKKWVFFQFLGPLVLHSNEIIQADRDRIKLIIKALRSSAAVSSEDQAFLLEMATTYKVIEGESDLTDRTLQDTLLRRVDTIPPSLVLAQAAEESGWGTSRFAAEGNALFGMWTWGGKGVVPLQQRSDLGNYKIAYYETPLQSVVAYMNNLNTHQAYRELRARRAELRKAGVKVSGRELAKTLTRYSERGQAYVNSLLSLIKMNKLQLTDDAYLGNGPTILLVAVGEGAN
jgi:uncharacterized FlgJ-related protein